MLPKSQDAHPDTREALLNAGLWCFAHYGFEGTSVRRLATAAGRNSSMIAYHFGNKEGLYREVLLKVLSGFASPVTEESADPTGGATPEIRGLSRLGRIITRILSQIHIQTSSKDPSRESAAHLLLAELHAPKAGTRELLRDHFEPLVKEIRICLKNIRPDLNDSEIDLWGLIVQGTCFGYGLMTETELRLWSHVNDWADPEAMSQQISSFLLLGLLSRSSAG